jgi:hypothetical protein
VTIAGLEPAPTQALNARPSSQIPWDEVGDGWIAFTFATPSGEFVGEPPVQSAFTVGLYLLSPDDEIFGVVGWPSERGLRVDAVVGDGSAALVADGSDDGLTAGESMRWLDLVTLAAEPFEPPDAPPGTTPDPAVSRVWHVVPSPTAGDLLVHQVVYRANPDGRQEPVLERLSRVPADRSRWAALVDVPLGLTGRELGFVELDSGDLVTEAFGELVLRSPDGQALQSLQPPATDSRIVREWPDGRVLVSCADPTAGQECWTRGLWLVPIDGSEPELLVMPTGEAAAGQLAACFFAYSDAIALDGAIAFVGGKVRAAADQASN